MNSAITARLRTGVVVGGSVLFVLSTIVEALAFHDTPLGRAVASLLRLVPILFAGLSPFLVARQETAMRSETRLGWCLVGGGALAWLLGQSHWPLQLLLPEMTFLPPWLGDTAAVLSYPVMTLGLVLLIGRLRPIASLQLSIDGAIVAGTAAIILWHLLTDRSWYPGSPITGRVLHATHVLGNVILVFVATKLAIVASLRRKPALFAYMIAGGAVFLAFVHGSFLLAYAGYPEMLPSSCILPAWFLGWFAIGLAPYLYQEETERPPIEGGELAQPWRTALRGTSPYLVAAVVFFGLAVHGMSDTAPSVSLLVPGFIIVLLAVLRQVLSLAEYREMTEALRQANKELSRFRQAIVDNPEVWISVIDREARVSIWNKGAERISGYPSAEVLGRRSVWRKLTAGTKSWAELMHEMRRLPQGKETDAVIGSLYTKAGIRRTISCVAQSLVADDGTSVGFVLIGIDITGRQRAEEESRRLWRAIDQAVETIMITSPTGIVLYVNPAVEAMTGFSPREIVGTSAFKPGPWSDDLEALEAIWDRLEHGEIWTGKRTRFTKSSAKYVEETVIAPVRDATGQISAYVSTHRDITYEYELEAQLRQAQKMEAIGTLAGGIAHDFNNILQAVLGFTDLVVRALPEGAKARDHLGHVLTAARRGADLAARILAFSRQREQERRPLPLQPVVDEVAKLLRGTFPSTITIEVQATNHCRPVFADLTELHQVLMNICTNAYHAMQPNGGTLSITLNEITVPSQEWPALRNLSPGPYSTIRIADTGCGMDETVVARVFEPYFTTKERSRGTGLGLATAHGIVADSGGTILVESKVGQGSTFTVVLPVCEEERKEAETPIPPVEDLRGTERILLADDEEPIRRLALSALTDLGYKVEVYASGDEAFARLRTAREGFDVVVTDMTMPGMSGLELAQKTTQLHPEVPVVLCSGFMDVIDEQAAARAGIRAFMNKPFTVLELAKIIRDLFQAKPRT